MELIRGWWVGGGGGWWGWVGKLKAGLPYHSATDSVAVLSTDDRDVHKPQERSRRPLAAAWHTTNSDKFPQWANRACNPPTRFYKVVKNLSVKADLAIYSHAFDVGGQCMSESLTLGQNLDFSFCDIMAGFCKSSHIQIPEVNKVFKAII